MNDAGAIRYFGGRYTIDLIGLNYHPLVRDKRAREQITSSPWAMREYMKEHGAEYLIVFPEWFPEVVGPPAADELFRVVFVASGEHYAGAPEGWSTMMVYMPR